jgi:dimethylaniline monooxygenase (N-oxide forming)
MYDIIIIGSGWAGICTMKHCLEEGLTGIVLEKNNDYGGVWNIENSPSVYANTYSVTSKYYLSMSDFPIPESYPEFPHHSQVMEYMRMYVDHFGLKEYISFDSEVIELSKKGDVWNVSYNKNHTPYTIEAKHIAICTGQNSKCKNYPDIDGSSFKGKIYHASDYNENVKNECLNKKVLIYGGSDTAFDIGVELTNNMYTAKDNSFGYTGPNGTISDKKTTVYISMHKGRWIQRRTGGAHNPADMFYNRVIDTAVKTVSKSLVYFLFIPWLEILWGKSGSGVPEWQTNAGYLNSYYIKSADILPKITFGDVIPLRGISTIKSNHIITSDNKEYEIDIIIFATGYKGFSCFKFIPDTIQKGRYYDHIFLIDDPSVAKVGFIRPYLTSIPMIIEMQSRYVAKVFAKKSFAAELEYHVS